MDFATADPAAWTRADRPTVEVVREEGRSLLRVSGDERLHCKLPWPERRDFAMQVRLRGPGGVQFRDRFKVFFKGNGDVWVRRPGSMLLDWVRTPRDMQEFHTLRVVACGRIVRVYIDDELEFEGLDHKPVAGAFHLIGAAEYEWIRLEQNVSADEALMVTPKDAGANFHEEMYYARLENPQGERVQDVALAFEAGQPVRIALLVLNEACDAAAAVEVRAALDDFDQVTLKRNSDAAIVVPAAAQREYELNLGAIERGFHRLQLTLLRDRRPIRTTSYPVFVGMAAEAATFQAPTFPFAAALRTVIWKPIHAKTYWHAIASLLRANHLNAVMCTNSHREFPETFERYGIATIERTESRLDHRAVIGMLSPGTDARKLPALQQTSEKPVSLVLPVERVGSGRDDDPVIVWRRHSLRVRAVRIAPFRQWRDNWLALEGTMTLPLALRRVATEFDTPWWAVLQATGERDRVGRRGGDRQPERSAGERNPTEAQLRAQSHLALAFGAKGLVYENLQGGPDRVALVDWVSLKPVDGKLRALSELGALVQANTAWLSDYRVGDAEVHSEPAAALAVAGTAQGRRCIYVVNTDVSRETQAALFVPPELAGTAALDCFAGQLVSSRDGRALRLTLAPGEGKLLIFGE